MRDSFVHRIGCFDEETRLRQCAEDLKKKLQQLNEIIISNIQNHLNAAVENVIANIRYDRVTADGPRIKEISEKVPLISR
jgi:glycogen debranching enzyme